MSVLLVMSQWWDPWRFLRSLAELCSHWLPTGPAGMAGSLHDLCDLLLFVLIQLFIHLGTVATEHWTPDFLKFLRGGRFLRCFLGQLFLNVLIDPHRYPGHVEKGSEDAGNSIGLGKRVKMDVNDSFRTRSVGREGVCATWGQSRGSYEVVSMGKRTMGEFSSPWLVLDLSW